jgi:hypothetical protein
LTSDIVASNLASKSRHLRLVRVEPLLHLRAVVVLPRETDRNGSVAGRRVQHHLDVRVALRIERVVLQHHLHGARVARLVLRENRLVLKVRLAARRALEVVELDDEHLGAFR